MKEYSGFDEPEDLRDADLVTVVIPTRNRREPLLRAIRSVLQQNYEQLEIIVVDDASTDGTASYLEQLQGPNLRYVRTERNVGGAAARNIGIQLATGTFIAFLDSDDVWLPRKLQAQLELFRNRPSVGVVYCREYLGYRGYLLERPMTLYEGDVFPHLAGGWCPATTSDFIVRSEVMSECEFDEKLLGFQDYDLWLRLAQLTEFAAVDSVLTIFEQEAGGRLTRQFGRRRAALEAIQAKWLPRMRQLGLETAFVRACAAWEFDLQVSELSRGGAAYLPHKVRLLLRSRDYLGPKARFVLFFQLLVGERLYRKSVGALVERRHRVPRERALEATEPVRPGASWS